VTPATAAVSCRLLEVDFASIEAILTGYFLHRHLADPGARQYIRLARCGMHAAVTARAAGVDVDFTLPDADLAARLAEVKHAHKDLYDPCKRVVHGNNYGLTIYGMVEKFPTLFPTIAAAQRFQTYYHDLAPALPTWHTALRKHAREVGHLGGPTLPGAVPTIWDHPYGYRHWFWDVLSYRPCDEFTARKWLADPIRRSRIVPLHGRWFKTTLGNDANRVVAFYPQSTASGRLKEAELDLFADPDADEYIGDAYFGRTPLLVPVHDSLLLHVPVRGWDRVVEIVARAMQRPSMHLPIPETWGWGSHLSIGISMKAGKNWLEMEEIDFPRATLTGGSDLPVLPREGEGEEQDWRELERVVA
jgi:hypothetical protein